MSEVKEPQPTCPDIDRAKGYLEDAADSIKSLVEAIASAEKQLEEVREANIDLRSWANINHQECSMLMERVKGLERFLQELTVNSDLSLPMRLKVEQALISAGK